ncbi:RNA polymerase sigma factor sigB-like [Canna indica]|uniref:RNA polymerase sigma factor n=1 Tax=Canna indica TaxID=4628 RepID=A0AAQ3L1T4_9LILI|nr:RNA polymerase sigma factor sigB-like [Canna indica]
MACLVPQFRPPSSSDAHSRSSLPSLLPKARESVCIRVHCVLSPATAVVDFEQKPKLEAHCTSSSTCAIRPLTYVGAVGPPTKTSIETTLASEALLTSEEAVIAAASAEAVALARAALELAKDATQLIGKYLKTEVEKSDISQSEADTKWHESYSPTETEWGGVTNHSTVTETKLLVDNVALDQPLHTDNSSGTCIEPDIQITDHTENIAVKSRRQTERRARRARAAEKGAAGVISQNYGSSGKKKCSTLQEIDYSDPLRFLRGTTSTSKLLTAAEEIELSEGIQDLLKLERLKLLLAERNGCQPTFAQWAAAAGTDQKALRKRLNYGTHCKDKMITSNIRLVISIAKNYQGIGMDLSDLVQEGCKGLIRGAEKFDASRGFKFSTYAHWWIRQSVRKSLSEQSRTIRLPFHMVEATYRVKEASKQLYSENGRHPDHEEVAEAAGLSMKKLATVMLAPKAPRSLDQKIGINQSLKLSEVIADPDAETSEDILIKQFMRKDLNKVLDTLNLKEKQVLRRRFGLEDGRMQTLQEIGDSLGVTRERVRQIEANAFRKLKNKNRAKNLKQYITS